MAAIIPVVMPIIGTFIVVAPLEIEYMPIQTVIPPVKVTINAPLGPVIFVISVMAIVMTTRIIVATVGFPGTR